MEYSEKGEGQVQDLFSVALFASGDSRGDEREELGAIAEPCDESA